MKMDWTNTRNETPIDDETIDSLCWEFIKRTKEIDDVAIQQKDFVIAPEGILLPYNTTTDEFRTVQGILKIQMEYDGEDNCYIYFWTKDDQEDLDEFYMRYSDIKPKIREEILEKLGIK